MIWENAFDNSDEVMNEINITPLVDVMLVLLIVFIITVPVLTHTVKLDLPHAATKLNEIQPQTVTIAVTADGHLHWNDTQIDDTALQLKLTQAAAQQPQPEIHLRGDRKVDYEHVIQVMAAAQRAGILRLGFVTEPGE